MDTIRQKRGQWQLGKIYGKYQIFAILQFSSFNSSDALKLLFTSNKSLRQLCIKEFKLISKLVGLSQQQIGWIIRKNAKELVTTLNHDTQDNKEIVWVLEYKGNIYYGNNDQKVYYLNNQQQIIKVDGIYDDTYCAIALEDKLIIGGFRDMHIVKDSKLIKSIWQQQDVCNQIIRIADDVLLSCYESCICVTSDSNCNIIHTSQFIGEGLEDIVRCSYDKQLFATISAAYHLIAILEVDASNHITIINKINLEFMPVSLSLAEEGTVIVGGWNGELAIVNINTNTVNTLDFNCDDGVRSIKSVIGGNTNDQRISQLTQKQKQQLFISRTSNSIQLFDLTINQITTIKQIKQSGFSDIMQLNYSEEIISILTASGEKDKPAFINKLLIPLRNMP